MTMTLPPGSTAKFRVHDAQHGYGSIWTVQTSTKAGDVYVRDSEGGEWIHSSFHDSGQWHYGVSKSGLEISEKSTPRFLEVTRTRPEIGVGWTHALRVTVAKSELRFVDGRSDEPTDLIGVPTHSAYDAVCMDMFLGEPDAGRIRIELGLLIAKLTRGDGGQVLLVGRPTNLRSKIRDDLAEEIAEAKMGLRGFGWDGAPTRIVIILSSDADFGFQHQIEVAIDE
jgi:hypothetical protein